MKIGIFRFSIFAEEFYTKIINNSKKPLIVSRKRSNSARRLHVSNVISTATVVIADCVGQMEIQKKNNIIYCCFEHSGLFEYGNIIDCLRTVPWSCFHFTKRFQFGWQRFAGSDRSHKCQNFHATSVGHFVRWSRKTAACTGRLSWNIEQSSEKLSTSGKPMAGANSCVDWSRNQFSILIYAILSNRVSIIAWATH